MRGFLLDTCVISEPTRSKASDKVLAWLDGKPAESLYISVITIAEIEQGIAHVGAGLRVRKLETWLRDTLVPMFESRTLDVDLAVARRWGRLQGDALRRGHPLAVVDSLLAATAMEHDLSIVTRNIKDFATLDVQLINPWQ
jgi:predicted nucleic acid-binding protein